MTTITEVSDLKADMDAKFQKVYDQLAELATDVNGLGVDVSGLRVDVSGLKEDVKAVNGRLDTMDTKLDKLTINMDKMLKANGIDNDETAV